MAPDTLPIRERNRERERERREREREDHLEGANFGGDSTEANLTFFYYLYSNLYPANFLLIRRSF